MLKTMKKIINCYNSAEILAETKVEAKDGAYAGGIAGFFSDESYDDGIRNCHNSGKISAISSRRSFAGGIAGEFFGNKIHDCRNSGKVTTDGGDAGGIVGICHYGNYGSGAKISKCSNSGEIFTKNPGSGSAGSIAGYDHEQMISDYDHNSNSGELIELSSARKK
jgi:hypothetical protein